VRLARLRSWTLAALFESGQAAALAMGVAYGLPVVGVEPMAGDDRGTVAVTEGW
jgi:hypothetical protein